VHHLSDRQLGSPRNKKSDFHIWGDIASATSNLNMAVIFDNVPKENVKRITDELKQIAREFEVDEIHYKIDKELQDLIDFMNPGWKPKALDSD
jgi:tRNA A37 threonylcarbamoyladenosine dehydratase